MISFRIDHSRHACISPVGKHLTFEQSVINNAKVIHRNTSMPHAPCTMVLLLNMRT